MDDDDSSGTLSVPPSSPNLDDDLQALEDLTMMIAKKYSYLQIHDDVALCLSKGCPPNDIISALDKTYKLYHSNDGNVTDYFLKQLRLFCEVPD